MLDKLITTFTSSRVQLNAVCAGAILYMAHTSAVPGAKHASI